MNEGVSRHLRAIEREKRERFNESVNESMGGEDESREMKIKF